MNRMGRTAVASLLAATVGLQAVPAMAQNAVPRDRVEERRGDSDHRHALAAPGLA